MGNHPGMSGHGLTTILTLNTGLANSRGPGLDLYADNLGDDNSTVLG